MEIGTIGAGPFAQAFAKQALKAGHRVKLSNRRGLESLREIVDQLGPGAQAATKEEAAAWKKWKMRLQPKCFVFWSGRRESNPRPKLGKLSAKL